MDAKLPLTVMKIIKSIIPRCESLCPVHRPWLPSAPQRGWGGHGHGVKHAGCNTLMRADHGTFADKFGRFGMDNMHPEHFLGYFVYDHFGEALSLIGGNSLATSCEREFANSYLVYPASFAAFSVSPIEAT
jgi:hypothetical protein